MTDGWIKLMRTEKTLELLKNKNAFMLLTLIAYRARRNSKFNIKGLVVGEALLGDYKNYGMSEQEYRTAKQKLAEWNFATFRVTNRGTIAKLTDNNIYDINPEPQQRAKQQSSNGQATDKQRLTRSKEGKEVKNKHTYMEFVKLTDDEHKKLVEKFGKEGTQQRIEALNEYIGKIGEAKAKKKYSSHYFTILCWSRKNGNCGKARRAVSEGYIR